MNTTRPAGAATPGSRTDSTHVRRRGGIPLANLLPGAVILIPPGMSLIHKEGFRLILTEPPYRSPDAHGMYGGYYPELVLTGMVRDMSGRRTERGDVKRRALADPAECLLVRGPAPC